MIFVDWITPVSTLLISVVLPFVVNLVKQESWSTTAKMWVAIIFSGLVGLATGLLTGLPSSENLVTWTLATIGGVQTAYALFKSVGVTCKWLDALENIGSKDE